MAARLRTMGGILTITATALAGCGGGTGSPASGTASSGTAGNPTKAVTVNEAGSTLLLPFLQEVVTPLRQSFSNIVLHPSGGGSGLGIADALNGTIDLGGSDAYLSNSQAQANLDVLDLPVVVSSQAVNYNLPGIENLRLNGSVLAEMYRGTITSWNDQQIGALNPGVTLPSTHVVPVHRSEGSGDTFLFTQFLSNTNASWQSSPGYGATIDWPSVPGELSAKGNSGMVKTCGATPGCVAYIGISSEKAAAAAGLGEAMLENKAGSFLLPTHDTVTAALYTDEQLVPSDLRQSLVYAAGANSYPIVNYEYLMVHLTQPSAAKALAIRTLLTWLVDPAQGSSLAYLSPVNFVALPEGVLIKVQAAIPKISS